MIKKIIVRGPLLTQSGYGVRARFCLRALLMFPERFDVYVIATPWGQCGWIFEDNEERKAIDLLIHKTLQYHQSCGGNPQYDLSLQITIPNEWSAMAKENIGDTAGVETTKISGKWVESSMHMDKIICTSEHTAYGFRNTKYPATNRLTGEQVVAQITKPIEVVGYPVRNFDPEPLELELPHDFNFLCVAQWSVRKNLEGTIKCFVEEFMDKPVGLVLKVFQMNNAICDRDSTEQRIRSILSSYPDRKCSVVLLHGDLGDGQMTTLYRHPKIKAIINLAHGEGWGLPLFEASYNGLPIITPAWGGQCDFIFAPDKKGKQECLASSVSYDIKQIQPEAVWADVLIPESSWCFPLDWNVKTTMREVYKNHGSAKAKAKKLMEHNLVKFEEKKVMTMFADAVYSPKEMPSNINNEFNEVVEIG